MSLQNISAYYLSRFKSGIESVVCSSTVHMNFEIVKASSDLAVRYAAQTAPSDKRWFMYYITVNFPPTATERVNAVTFFHSLDPSPIFG